MRGGQREEGRVESEGGRKARREERRGCRQGVWKGRERGRDEGMEIRRDEINERGSEVQKLRTHNYVIIFHSMNSFTYSHLERNG